MFLQDLLNLQRQIDRFFGEDLYPKSTFGRGIYPAVNLFETEGSVVLKAELPGMKKDDIKIELCANTLSISGAKNQDYDKDVTFHRREREWGSFSRKIQLPLDVDAEKIKAEMQNGVLTINLEKAPTAKPKQITIN